MRCQAENVFKLCTSSRPSVVEKIYTVTFYVVFVLRVKAECVKNCSGVLPVVQYKSCDGCTKYVTCDLLGQLTTHTCLFGMAFDENFHICTPFSGSCSDPQTVATVTARSASTTSAATMTSTGKSASNADKDKTTTLTTTNSGTTSMPQKPFLNITLPGLGSISTVQLITPKIPLQKPSAVGNILTRFMYINIVLRTAPCVANASFYKSIPIRSTIECGSACNHELQCWYFQVKDQECLMFSLSLPPCDVSIYKYIG